MFPYNAYLQSKIKGGDFALNVSCQNWKKDYSVQPKSVNKLFICKRFSVSKRQ